MTDEISLFGVAIATELFDDIDVLTTFNCPRVVSLGDKRLAPIEFF